jgi:hypothetical protein
MKSDEGTCRSEKPRNEQELRPAGHWGNGRRRREPLVMSLVSFEVRQLWFEPLTNSFVVFGQVSGEDVRFAVSKAAVNSVGWDASMLEVFRRLSAGERNFGIAPSSTGMVSWKIPERTPRGG